MFVYLSKKVSVKIINVARYRRAKTANRYFQMDFWVPYCSKTIYSYTPSKSLYFQRSILVFWFWEKSPLKTDARNVVTCALKC